MGKEQPRAQAETFTEDIRKDKQALQTREELRAQPKVSVFMQWTAEDQKNFRGSKPLPYPRVETVSINEVRYHLERGKMHQVPLSVAIVLANAGKIDWSMIPDCEDKENYLAHLAEQEAERRARYAGIGEGLVASVGKVAPGVS